MWGDEDEAEAGGRVMEMEVAESIGPLYAGRTYFLGTGARAPPRPPNEAAEDLLDASESAGPMLRRRALRLWVLIEWCDERMCGWCNATTQGHSSIGAVEYRLASVPRECESANQLQVRRLIDFRTVTAKH